MNKDRVLQNARAYLGNNVKLYPSTRKGKKWMIERPDGKRVHFGSSAYQDFTQHQDKERRYNYLARSSKIRGNWNNDKYSPNMLSREILWR